ncbi:UNVERIFIED_ORG: L-amino acid N-acyltransferase YncA [Arthrobacter sp. UYCu721]
MARVNAATTPPSSAEYLIRHATDADWPGIWAVLEPVIRSGETFTWDRDTTEADARARWFKDAPCT